MNYTKNTKLTRLAITALLAAMVVIVSFLPLKTLGLEISFAMVPVAVGSIFLGPAAGALLGGVFGTVSFLQCFGYSSFGVLLLGENPWLTLIVCLPTRILAGLIPGLLYKCISKANRNAAAVVASMTAPLLNTVFFMSTLVAFFYKTETVQYFVDLLSASNPFMFIILFVGINGLVEIAAGFIVTLPVAQALVKHLKL